MRLVMICATITSWLLRGKCTVPKSILYRTWYMATERVATRGQTEWQSAVAVRTGQLMPKPGSRHVQSQSQCALQHARILDSPNPITRSANTDKQILHKHHLTLATNPTKNRRVKQRSWRFSSKLVCAVALRCAVLLCFVCCCCCCCSCGVVCLLCASLLCLCETKRTQLRGALAAAAANVHVLPFSVQLHERAWMV